MSYTLINIGDVKVSAFPDTLVCRGLGSCIGLFLFDTKLKFGGAAHIMLPGKLDQKNNETIYAKPAIDSLIQKMTLLGAKKENLVAKIVGGASVLKVDPFKVGSRNTEIILQILKNFNIPVSAFDTGKTAGRTAHFSSKSGEIQITNTNQETYYI